MRWRRKKPYDPDWRLSEKELAYKRNVLEDSPPGGGGSSMVVATLDLCEIEGVDDDDALLDLIHERAEWPPRAREPIDFVGEDWVTIPIYGWVEKRPVGLRRTGFRKREKVVWSYYETMDRWTIFPLTFASWAIKTDDEEDKAALYYRLYDRG